MSTTRTRSTLTAIFRPQPWLGLVCLLGSLQESNATPFINEVKVNPPGTDSGQEFIEIWGKAQQPLHDTYLIAVGAVPDGSHDQAGKLMLVIPLGDAALGTAGGLLVRSSTGPIPPTDCTDLIASEFAGSPLDNGSLTILLIRSETPPLPSIDYDPGNEGYFTVAPLSTASVLDGVAWKKNGDHLVYTEAVLPRENGFTPDAAVRFPSNATPDSAAAWFYGELAGDSPASLVFESSAMERSSNFPTGGALTPGHANLPTPSIYFIADQIRVLNDPYSFPIRFLADGSLQLTAASDHSALPPSSLQLSSAGNRFFLSVQPLEPCLHATITITARNTAGHIVSTRSFLFSAAPPVDSVTNPRFHSGMSDASTAVALDSNYMLVADDETQALRLYHRHQSRPPLREFDFSYLLGLDALDSDGHRLELDLEAAVKVSNRIYFLGGLGNSRTGKLRSNRNRLFAVEVSGTGFAVELAYIGSFGRSHTDGLRGALVHWDQENQHGHGANYFGLADGAAEGNHPKQDAGFNIEGLAMAPGAHGNSVAYLALRAPLNPGYDRHRALIVPLLNLPALVEGNPAKQMPQFGPPIELNLGQRGIRSLDGNDYGYVIVAGPTGDPTGDPYEFRLFTWSGYAADEPVERNVSPHGLVPEGIVELPEGPILPETVIQLVSDNGSTRWFADLDQDEEGPDDRPAKELPLKSRFFRSDRVAIGSAVPQFDFYAPNPAAHSGKFARGNPFPLGAESVVLPLHAQKGVPLNIATADVFFPGHNWHNELYHFDISAPQNRSVFNTPIAAFGSTAGGTPLQTRKSYSFRVSMGDGPANAGSSLFPTFALHVYDRGSMAKVDSLFLSLPHQRSPDYAAFVRDGSEHASERYGLRTTIRLISLPHAAPAEYVLTHFATKPHYIFLVAGTGYVQGNPDSDYDGRRDQQEALDGTNPASPDDVVPERLSRWGFNRLAHDQFLFDDHGREPRQALHWSAAPGLFGNAIELDHPYPATAGPQLVYEIERIAGPSVVNLRKGSIRLWFKPDWSLPNWTGYSAPYLSGRLVEVGSWTPDGSRGLWHLAFGTVPDSNLYFVGQNHGRYEHLLHVQPSFSAGWNQLVLTYDPTSSALYLNGKTIATGSGTLAPGDVPLWPAAQMRELTGLRFGSSLGSHQARGAFDEVETFNYRLSAAEIAAEYAVAVDPNHAFQPFFTEPLQTRPVHLPLISITSASGTHAAQASITVGALVSYSPANRLALVQLSPTGSHRRSASYSLSSASADSLSALIENAGAGDVFIFASKDLQPINHPRLQHAFTQLGFHRHYSWTTQSAWLGIAQKGRGHAWQERALPPINDSTLLSTQFHTGDYFAAQQSSRQPIVLDAAGHFHRSPLYVVSFDQLPPWRSRFLNRPHFNSDPMPVEFQGRSLAHLTGRSSLKLPSLPNPAPGQFLELDHSPELRRHPRLDQLVSDHQSSPLSLANFVFNEIELVDWLDYHSEIDDSFRLEFGGINRSALATLEQLAGSPLEQCALLVYLLRQAGYPAAYAFPEKNSLKLLDSHLNSLLRLQVSDPADEPRLVPINYPWVVAHIDGQWRHLFPWLKDTEVTEGFDLYEFMPPQYDTAREWLLAYLDNDPAVIPPDALSDQPDYLFPSYLRRQLQAGHHTVALEDLGVRAFDRQRHYSDWDEFPTPLQAGSMVPVDSITAHNPLLFNTVEFEIESKSGPAKKIKTGPLLLADLHNRYLVLDYEKTAPDQHRLRLSLESLRPDAVTVMPFAEASADFSLAAHPLRDTLNLSASDELITWRVTHRRSRHLSQAAPYQNHPWQFFYVESGQKQMGTDFQTEDQFLKGDAVAFCFSIGPVPVSLLDRHTRVLQQDPPAGRQIPNLLHLFGMSYWHRLSRFDRQNQDLHKVRLVSTYGHGFAILHADRLDGKLPNQGDIELVQPAIHIVSLGRADVFNGTIHPHSQNSHLLAQQDYMLMGSIQASAAEHGVINHFFGQQEALSTIKLLQMNAPHFLQVHSDDFTSAATTMPTDDQVLWQKVVDHFSSTSHYRENLRAIITSQKITTPYFQGHAALTVGYHGSAGAYISGRRLGGIGPVIKDGRIIGYILPTPAGPIMMPVHQNPIVSAPDGTQIPLYQQTLAKHNLTMSEVLNQQAQQAAQTVAQMHQAQAQINPNKINNPDLMTPPTEEMPANRGFLGRIGSALRNIASMVSDPVNIMTGEFYVDEVDLHLPGPMPLQLRRNYSSQNLAAGTLGHGWRLNHMPYLVVSIDDSLIHAAEPDGAVYAYRQTQPDLWQPHPQDNPLHENHTVQGVGGDANMFNAVITRLHSHPQADFRLRTPDGHQRYYQWRHDFAFDADYQRIRPYLTRWEDERGNSFTFHYMDQAEKPGFGQIRSIHSSNGATLHFKYDAFGLLREAFTTDGRRVRYEYDSYGDLTAVIRPDRSVIRYQYEPMHIDTDHGPARASTHLLTRVIKPHGQLLQNTYDPLRRVIAQQATVGTDWNLHTNAVFHYENNQADLTHSGPLTGYSTVTDPYGQTTRYDYVSSRITKVTGPHQHSLQKIWYPDTAQPPGYPRSVQREIDPRGLITDYEYDQWGNVTKIVAIGDLVGDGDSHSPSDWNPATRQFRSVANRPQVDSDSNPEQAVTTCVYVYDPSCPDPNKADPIYRHRLWKLIEPGPSTASTKVTEYIYDTERPLLLKEARFTPAPGAKPIVTAYSYTDVVTSDRAAYGLLHVTQQAAGTTDEATQFFEYDARGFPTASTSLTGGRWTTPDSLPALAHSDRDVQTGPLDPHIRIQFRYNDRGELAERIAPDHTRTRFFYDAAGRLNGTEVFAPDASEPLSWTYTHFDGNGNEVWRDGPGFDPEDYVWSRYDGANRKIEEVRWRIEAKPDGTGLQAAQGDDLYAVSRFGYDYLGNLTRLTDPEGNRQFHTYNDLGNRIRTTWHSPASGKVLAEEQWAYEPGGNISIHTNRFRGVTYTYYTSTGRPRRMIRPDGTVLEWRYYLDGRLRRQYLPGGTYWEHDYDDAGRRTTRRLHSANGTVIPATRHATTRDRRGNVIATLSPEGHTTTTTYDDVDRSKTWHGPPTRHDKQSQQQTFRYYHYPQERISLRINARLEEQRTDLDPLGRTRSIRLYSPNPNLLDDPRANDTLTPLQVTATDWAPGHHTATTTQGSGTRSYQTATSFNTRGQPLLVISSPGSAPLYRLNIYDRNGNLTATRDGQGYTTLFSYNALNQLDSQTSPENAVTRFVYDAAGNLAERHMPGDLTWRAHYDSSNRLEEEWLEGSDESVSRHYQYSYYPPGHAWEGLLHETLDPRLTIHRHHYDQRRRLQERRSTLPAGEGIAQTFAYNPAGQIISSSTTDILANGSLSPDSAVTVHQLHDGYGQLLTEQVITGSGISAHVQHARQFWDSAGRRARLTLSHYPAQMPAAALWVNKDGSFISSPDPIPFSFVFEHDAAGNLTRLNTSSGSHADSFSFSYDSSGRLLSRANAFRHWLVERWDDHGRPKRISTTAASDRWREYLRWRSDHKLETYTLVRAGVGRGVNFKYNPGGRLISQSATPDGSTQTFGYDPAGLGTRVRFDDSQYGPLHQSRPDPFARAGSDAFHFHQRTAFGHAPGAGHVEATLNQAPLPNLVFPATGDGKWMAPMELLPGSHQLEATAHHPHLNQSVTASASFDVSDQSPDAVQNEFDPVGNLTRRTWRDHAGRLIRQQDFEWDVLNRLIRVLDHHFSDAPEIELEWRALYDPFNRRIRVQEIPQHTHSFTYRSFNDGLWSQFDPEVEFLELKTYDPLANTASIKIYGPDLTGRYGALQGAGGLEAVVRQVPTDQASNGWYPYPDYLDQQTSYPLTDFFGNTHPTASDWTAPKPRPFGPLPGEPEPIYSNGTSLVDATTWRSKRIDRTGLFWFGARYYDPHSGRFITPDPFGHNATPDLYAYANNDPINLADPDGRMATATLLLAGTALSQSLNLGHSFAKIAPVTAERFLTGLLPGVRAQALSYNSMNLRNGFHSGYRYHNLMQGGDFLTQVAGILRHIPLLGNFVPGPKGNMGGPITIFISGGIYADSTTHSNLRDVYTDRNMRQYGHSFKVASAPYDRGTASDVLFGLFGGNTAQGLDFAYNVIQSAQYTHTIGIIGHSGGVFRSLNGTFFLGVNGVGVAGLFAEQGPALGYYSNVQSLSANYSIGRDVTSNFGALLSPLLHNAGNSSFTWSLSNAPHRQGGDPRGGNEFNSDRAKFFTP